MFYRRANYVLQTLTLISKATGGQIFFPHLCDASWFMLSPAEGGGILFCQCPSVDLFVLLSFHPEP